MDLPPATDSRWQNIITGKTRHRFEFLAAKVFLGRVYMELAQEEPEPPSPAKITHYASELRELFMMNARLASVQRDLQKVLAPQREETP